MFISCSSLWTHFDCVDMDKTRVYLERSKSSPIILQIERESLLSPHDPLFQVIPNAASRLKSLSVQVPPESVGDIITHLSHPAPLLEDLSIDCGYELDPWDNPVLTTSLFNGNLSSLHNLRLRYVRTTLPWRNMVNLTSFALGPTPPGEVSMGQLLDFFENAPRLDSVELHSATPTTDTRRGRLVSLERLKWMNIRGDDPCSLLLDHLLIPAGAWLAIWSDSLGSRLEGHFPRSLDNLRNLTNFTKIDLYLNDLSPEIRFTGPNGRVSVTCTAPQDNPTSPVFEYLAQVNASGIERLEIDYGRPPSGDLVHRVLLPMNSLRTLKLSRCKGLRFFVHALHPNTNPSRVVVCPNLEELVLRARSREAFDIGGLIDMAAARESEGAKLRTVGIIGGLGKLDPGGVLELKKHALHVECDPGIGAVNDGSGRVIEGSDVSE